MGWASPAKARAYELNRPNREERLRVLREKRAAQYLDRKLRQVCVDCEAKLGPDDGVKCELCAGRDAVQKVEYGLTRRGRRLKRLAQRAYVKRKKKLDICHQCRMPRSKWPRPTPLQLKRRRVAKPRLCPTCRQEQTDNTREYRRRMKREGVTRMADVRELRRREKLRELRGQSYQPIDELLEDTTARILRGLVRFEWISSADLFDVIGVAEHDDADPKERSRFYTRLSYLVRVMGFIERRTAKTDKRRRPDRRGEIYEYRLSPSGRQELARRFAKARKAA